LQFCVARIQRQIDDLIRSGAIPGRHDVFARDLEVRRVGVGMAANTKKPVAVGWHIGFVVMLAQTGSPSRAGPETVGVFQPAMTPHTRNGVDAVLGVAGTAEVDHSLECSSAAMTVVTAGADIRVIQVGVVESGSPVKILRRRYVGTGLPEAGVTLSALSHRTDRV
jgi:hypothetical protein